MAEASMCTWQSTFEDLRRAPQYLVSDLVKQLGRLPPPGLSARSKASREVVAVLRPLGGSRSLLCADDPTKHSPDWAPM